ncbi:hypothetical protein KJI95_00485 [Shewanella sp. JM162201]|uniref:Capsule polysaccharide biosynthesis protein n=1 Tax=Shewanella jiangmenensis TaxID=2837387 RepID=A0ABS5UY32_9GAMM|nr:hypothetical protein [Shewanella jiangmenensis]
MNYFVINNNFHFMDVVKRAEHFSLTDVFLICIPHRLDLDEIKNSGFLYRVFESPSTSKLGWLNFIKMFKNRNYIDKFIQASEEDFLYIYTEYDLVNHYFVNKFKSQGAKVNLIEENGLATYALNKVATSDNVQPLIFKNPRFIFSSAIYSNLFVKAYSSGFETFPVMSDSVFDSVIYYAGVTCNRDFQPCIEHWNGIKSHKKVSEYGNVLFLSQDIYKFFMDKPEYLKLLSLIYEEVLSRFENVYFKFHPREIGTDIYDFVLLNFPKFIIVESSKPIETIINDLHPDLVVSFFSSSLINLAKDGWPVLFTISKWEGVETNEFLNAISHSLFELGFNK